jgi:hypothetical protein
VLKKQCTYNVILMRVRVTIVAVEKLYIFWECVCSPSYPAFKAHAPCYIVVWPVWLYHRISALSRKRYDFRKRFIEHRIVFWFSVHILYETFLAPRRIQRGIIINVLRTSSKVLFFLPDFNQIWIFSTDFLEMLKCRISWNSFQWEQSYFTRTDRQTRRS